MKRPLVLISIGVVWLAVEVLFVFLRTSPFSVDLGNRFPAVLSLPLTALAAGFLVIGWLIPLGAGVAALRTKQALAAQQSDPSSKRRLLLSVQVLIAAAGIFLGFWQAYRCAKIAFGYVAGYAFAAAWIMAFVLAGIGLALVMWVRTRRVGIGFIVAGLLSLCSFYGGIGVLAKLDRVAWKHEPPLASIGPDQNASAVIYFCPKTTEEQIENFSETVLQQNAEPRHAGRDFPVFVGSYLRLIPSQANGHDGVALTFRGTTNGPAITSYLTKIESDPRVAKVFTGIAPTAIRIANSRTVDINCR